MAPPLYIISIIDMGGDASAKTETLSLHVHWAVMIRATYGVDLTPYLQPDTIVKASMDKARAEGFTSITQRPRLNNNLIHTNNFYKNGSYKKSFMYYYIARLAINYENEN